MSERYTKLFSQSEPLYAEGSPVTIAAGALLLDNVGGRVLAQLKFKNVSSKTVKAVTVSITAKDTVGRVIGKPTIHQYLDLNALRDEEFGQKTAIFLPSESTREYEVRVTEAVFADNSVWTAPDDLLWQPVPKQEPLFPDDAELLKQYRIDVNPTAKYEPIAEKDLWFCACGAVNRAEESTCHSCETSLSAMKNADLDKLRENCSNRLEEERKADEARRVVATKKAKRIISITAPIVCACIALIIVLTTVIIPNGKYNNAVALLEAGNYEEAYDAFMALDGYKDSTEKARNIYANVCFLKANVGDTGFFGTYEQNNLLTSKEKIMWLVLAKEDNKVLIISKDALDCRPYNTTDNETTWENCSLRKWLNDDFLNSAFSAEERALIQSTRVSADENSIDDSVDQGNATTDKVFLLSITEAEEYLDSDEERMCYPTEYAEARAIDMGANISFRWWWLRTNDIYEGNKVGCLVTNKGWCNGVSEYSIENYVRPALWVTIGFAK